MFSKELQKTLDDLQHVTEKYVIESDKHKYAINQHSLICQSLNLSESPDDPGDTASEAINRFVEFVYEVQSFDRGDGFLGNEAQKLLKTF